MNRNKIEQENLCLQVKYLCDLLRTKLSLIDDFNDYKFYSNQLKKLKSQVEGIYWKL